MLEKRLCYCKSTHIHGRSTLPAWCWKCRSMCSFVCWSKFPAWWWKCRAICSFVYPLVCWLRFLSWCLKCWHQHFQHDDGSVKPYVLLNVLLYVLLFVDWSFQNDAGNVDINTTCLMLTMSIHMSFYMPFYMLIDMSRMMPENWPSLSTINVDSDGQ